MLTLKKHVRKLKLVMKRCTLHLFAQILNFVDEFVENHLVRSCGNVALNLFQQKKRISVVFHQFRNKKCIVWFSRTARLSVAASPWSWFLRADGITFLSFCLSCSLLSFPALRCAIFDISWNSLPVHLEIELLYIQKVQRKCHMKSGAPCSSLYKFLFL